MCSFELSLPCCSTPKHSNGLEKFAVIQLSSDNNISAPTYVKRLLHNATCSVSIPVKTSQSASFSNNSCVHTCVSDNNCSDENSVLQRSVDVQQQIFQFVEESKKQYNGLCSFFIVSCKPLDFVSTMYYVSGMYKCQLKFGVCIQGVFGLSYFCVLPKGLTEIKTDTGLEGDWCGLIPLGHPVTVSTTGLKWNLHDDIMELGGLISTSNELTACGKVTVSADFPILWVIGIKD